MTLDPASHYWRSLVREPNPCSRHLFELPAGAGEPSRCLMSHNAERGNADVWELQPRPRERARLVGLAGTVRWDPNCRLRRLPACLSVVQWGLVQGCVCLERPGAPRSELGGVLCGGSPVPRLWRFCPYFQAFSLNSTCPVRTFPNAEISRHFCCRLHSS